MKYGIVIPVHPPKFTEGLIALSSYNNVFKDRDLYFIFSNSGDVDGFRQFTNMNFKYFIADGTNNYHNTITYKKFYGMNKLFTLGYDYVLILDSETEFLKEIDVTEIKQIFNTKILKSNTSRDGGRLMRKCAEMLNITDIISKKTNDFTEYWWYNEVGIYEKDSFLEFYDYLIKTGNHSTMLNDTEYFDYMLYSIWLLSI